MINKIGDKLHEWIAIRKERNQDQKHLHVLLADSFLIDGFHVTSRPSC